MCGRDMGREYRLYNPLVSSIEKGDDENKRPEFLCDKHGWSLLLVAAVLDMSTIMAHFEDAFWAGPQDLGR